MELTVLGASGTWPPAGGATSGYLLSHEGTNVWLDAGTGTFSNLQRHIEISDLDAIVLTHGHADHFLDIIPCFYARHYGGLGAPALPLHAPDGFLDLAATLVSEGPRDVMREAYAFNIHQGGEQFEVGPFRVSTYEMTHVGVPALGYRFETDSGVFSYTGDTGPCEAATELAKGADLFMAEATYQDDQTLTFFHLSATQAATHAAEGGAERLVLTHIVPTADREVSKAQAGNVYDGPIELATVGSTIEVKS